jgi:1-acyl-sn-glycerol-3-phosphate acyltransferase
MSRGGPAVWRAFELFFRPWLRRRLSGIHLAGLPDSLPGPETPLLLVANHVSWYDGFLLREVHRRLRRRGVLRTVMLASELRSSPVLRMLGGTGFDPGRPQSLRGVLRDLERWSGDSTPLTVAFFPQGRIFPSTRTPLGFAPGLRLVSRSLAPCTVLGVGLHLEPGNRISPAAYVHAARPIPVPARSEVRLDEVEGGVADALARIHQHLHRHGEDAPGRWPSDPGLSLTPAGG